MTTLKAYARIRECSVNQIGSIAKASRQGRGLAALRFFAITLLSFLGVALLSSCGGGNGAVTLEVTPNVAQTVDQGQVINFMAYLGNDTKNQGVTWTLTGTGCAGTGCGTLTNVTKTSVTYTAPTDSSIALTVSLKAVANANSGATITSTITVVLPPTFTTTTLPNGSNGIAYSQQVVVTGGVPPLVFTVVCPSPGPTACLPPGLTLNQSGLLLGKPSGSGGTYTFYVKATDNGAVPQSNGSAQPLSVLSSLFTVVISPAAALSVSTTTLPPGTINKTYNGMLIAQGGVPPLTWSVPPGSLPPGLTLNTSTGLISGVPTTAGSYPFTAEVQDSAIPQQTAFSAAPITITVQPPLPLQATTPPLPGGFTATPYSSNLIATGGVPPYTWSVIAGQLPAGLTLDAGTGAISGTPILVGTTNFTVQVEDSQAGASGPAKASQPLNLSITTGTISSNTLISGNYSFLFTGYDSNGSVTIAGNFSADGKGNISEGVEDTNRVSAVFTGSTVTGTYSVGTDGRGTMQLIATNIKGAVFTANYLIALDTNFNAHFIENDTTGTTGVGITYGSGVMKRVLQTGLTGANFSGNYAFEFSGQDYSAKPIAVAGFVRADGSENLSPGMLDYNDAGQYGSQLSLSGNYSVGSSNARGFANFVFQLPSNAQITEGYDFYFVSPSDIFFIEIDTPSTVNPFPRLSGEMVLQQPATLFDLGVLQGTGVATGTGLDGSAASVFAGLVSSALGDGNVTFSYDQNDGGTVTLLNSVAGTYQVAANGRAGFTGLGPRLAAAYLTGPNQGFLIGSDNAATHGLLEQQTSGPVFSASSVQGGYTLSTPFTADPQVVDMSGELSSSGTGSLTGTVDDFVPPSTPNIGLSFFANYTFTAGSSGRGTMTASPLAGFPTNLVFYVVSPSSLRMIPTDSPGNGHPQVIYLDH
jgi:large repetitive protein